MSLRPRYPSPIPKSLASPRMKSLCRHLTTSASPHSSLKLQDRTALITGSSRGIGRAIADRFAAEGARCILVGRDEGTLRRIVDGLPFLPRMVSHETQMNERGGHEIVTGDVREAQFWKELRNHGKDGKGRRKIDILVNAAGVTHSSPFLITSEERMEEVLGTNLRGTVLGCKALGRGMVREGSGCIINIASLLGMKGGRGSAVYAASKAGIIGLTRALAAELGPTGIRANVIVPGYIETGMTDAMTLQARTDALNAIPLSPPRFGYPSEIADAAVFLATNQYANNSVLNLDGGLSAM